MKEKSSPPAKAKVAVLPMASPALVDELREWIQEARFSAARVVDEHLCALYWRIGSRIRTEILKDQRAEYGAGMVSAVGRQLEVEFGRGFSEKSLRHMVRFAEAFPDEQIVSAVRRQMTWTHFKRLIYLEDPLKRDFYVQMCRMENWSTRTLDKRINSMLFERCCWTWKAAASAWPPIGPNPCPRSSWSASCTRRSFWPGSAWRRTKGANSFLRSKGERHF